MNFLTRMTDGLAEFHGHLCGEFVRHRPRRRWARLYNNCCRCASGVHRQPDQALRAAFAASAISSGVAFTDFEEDFILSPRERWNHFFEVVSFDRSNKAPDRLKFDATRREYNGGSPPLDGIVGGDGVFRDDDAQVALEAFHGGGADTGVQMQAADDDGITICGAQCFYNSPPAKGLKPVL